MPSLLASFKPHMSEFCTRLCCCSVMHIWVKTFHNALCTVRTSLGKKSKFEAIFVTDYFPDKSKLSMEFRSLLEEPTWLQDYRDELDWRLAHLTMKRMDFEGNPSWQPEKILNHIESLITSFCRICQKVDALCLIPTDKEANN